MGWDQPWYSAEQSLDVLLVGREIGLFHLVLLSSRPRQSLRDVFGRNVAASRRWTTAGPCWTSPCTVGRRLALGHSDDLTVGVDWRTNQA
jgi:hypothetical protein